MRRRTTGTSKASITNRTTRKKRTNRTNRKYDE